ncbi:MAG TPA: hypothetical protein VKZ53_23840 [Candidatus Angelobacter sp.]|nr:hypothetical protein [Candidatus Angelobacter sp.]
MFGRMTISIALELDESTNINGAVQALLATTEKARIEKWIEFPAAVLVILTHPDDPGSAAFYVLDRRWNAWLAIDFDDGQYGGYTIEQCHQLMHECGLLSLIEKPGLLTSGLNWMLNPGEQPVAVAGQSAEDSGIQV